MRPSSTRSSVYSSRLSALLCGRFYSLVIVETLASHTCCLPTSQRLKNSFDWASGCTPRRALSLSLTRTGRDKKHHVGISRDLRQLVVKWAGSIRGVNMVPWFGGSYVVLHRPLACKLVPCRLSAQGLNVRLLLSLMPPLINANSRGDRLIKCGGLL